MAWEQKSRPPRPATRRRDHAMASPDTDEKVHKVSIVIPVYKGEQTLPHLIDEITPLTEPTTTPAGNRFQIDLVYPVWDNGPDHSDQVIRELAVAHDFVRPVWLSRNYGQHPATMAGMASTAGDWIVTMDEDGQHDPADIGKMLDTALRDEATVVYALPTNPPPHGKFRNWASKTAKKIMAKVMGSTNAPEFNSFRLVLGETGRALAAYAGPGVYLDVALGWIARRIATCPLTMRHEDRPSGYSLRSLTAHFLRMLVTSGTRGLRAVTFTGMLLGLLGVVFAIFLVIQALTGPRIVQGWTSTMCVILISTGSILGALGIIAEYIGVTVNVAMGRPLYLIVSDPADGPLGNLPAGRDLRASGHDARSASTEGATRTLKTDHSGSDA
ncbi:glycosyltransferase [Propionibacterium freudenreichii]|uniref:glycosyltransferase n=1 Tax=Propionibacterium freudenreichii TaxID=1744 RepID=UPI00254C8B46|nr:glycosyltransferase [Propionibacterium freudenreichii]